MNRYHYQTGIVGKWHLGLGEGQTRVDFNGEVKPGPLEIGFDYSHIIPAAVDRVPSVWIENHKVLNLDPNETTNVIAQHPEKAKELANQLEAIKDAAAKPAEAKR